jgi:hypothetical protein
VNEETITATAKTLASLDGMMRVQLMARAIEMIEAWVEHHRVPDHGRIHNTVHRWVTARSNLVKVLYPDFPKTPERYQPPIGVAEVSPRQVIEASRVLAANSRDQYATPLWNALAPLQVERSEKDKMFLAEMKNRMDLVMDCFNTGAAMMLKLLHGDSSAEPWSEEYDHETRLRELLEKYGCLAEPQTGEDSKCGK